MIFTGKTSIMQIINRILIYVIKLSAENTEQINRYACVIGVSSIVSYCWCNLTNIEAF